MDGRGNRVWEKDIEVRDPVREKGRERGGGESRERDGAGGGKRGSDKGKMKME